MTTLAVMPKPVEKPEKTRRRDRGDGGLFHVPGSKVWYTKVRGKKQSTGTRIKEEAKVILNARMGRAVLGIADPNELRKVCYEDGRARLIAVYQQEKRRSLKTLKKGTLTIDGLPYVDKFFGGRSVVDIKRDVLDKFVEQRQKDGASNAYINRNLALLHRMLTLLAEDHEGRLIVPKVPKLKEPPARQGFCEPEQFAKLFYELPERLRAFALFIYTTGCRTGEAKKLTWEQVNWKESVIRVSEEQTKNDTPRTIPLDATVVERLKKIPESRRIGVIFPVGCFRKAWQNACVRAGLGKLDKTGDNAKKNGRYGTYTGLTPHDFRRSAVRNMTKEGIGETLAMSVSGHKTAEVFRRYNIVTTRDKVAAVRRVSSSLVSVLRAKRARSAQ